MLGGLAGAAVVAAFAGQLGALFEGAGQELFNAAILLIAVIMLAWHNVWMASHGRALAQEMKAGRRGGLRGTEAARGLAIVCGIAVLREGSEVVLFLYGIFASGGTSKLAMLVGGVLGLVAGAALSALMYLGLVTIPTRYLFSFTSSLITLLAAGLAAQAVDFLQQAGYLDVLTATVWDSSWLLPEDSLLGGSCTRSSATPTGRAARSLSLMSLLLPLLSA